MISVDIVSLQKKNLRKLSEILVSLLSPCVHLAFPFLTDIILINFFLQKCLNRLSDERLKNSLQLVILHYYENSA